MKRRQNHKKLDRKGMRKIMLKTLLEAIDPVSIRSMTIEDIIAKINSGEMTKSELSRFISDNTTPTEEIRSAQRASRNEGVASLVQDAKQIIACYLLESYGAIDDPGYEKLTGISPDDVSYSEPTSKGDIPGGADVRQKFADFNKTFKGKIGPIKFSFTVKMCEKLVYHAFRRLGRQFDDAAAGMEFYEGNPMPNSGTLSARGITNAALNELKNEQLIIVNTEGTDVKGVHKRMAPRSGLDAVEISDEISGAVPKVTPQNLKEGLRRMILKEVMEMMPGLEIANEDEEDSYSDDDTIEIDNVSGLLALVEQARANGILDVVLNIPITLIED